MDDKLADWEDPDVQAAYQILIDDTEAPAGEHWEGFAARRIVAALRPNAGDTVRLPTSRKEAELMLILAKSYIKHEK